MPADLWLLAGIVAFWAYDAARMLYVDELVLWPGRRGWSASAGSRVQWRGGFAWLPGPLHLARPLLRLQWMRSPADAAPVQRVTFLRLLHALKPLQLAVWLMAVLLLVALPLVLVLWRHWQYLVLLLAAIYLLSSCMVVYTVRSRQALGLSRRALVSLSLDTLACPPFALNLVHKISLQHASAMDGVQFAAAVLAPADFQRLLPQLRERLDTMLLHEPDDTARAAQLRAYRDRLLETP